MEAGRRRDGRVVAAAVTGFTPKYPALTAGMSSVSVSRVDLVRIERHWEDILRIVGSIHTGAVRAYDVIRMLSREGRGRVPQASNFTFRMVKL